MARVMKDSGIEWIGEIPETWNTDRLQWHLNEVNVSNSPIQSENVLSLTIEAGVIPYEEKGNQGNKSKENYEEYKLAYPDTLVVNSMNVIIGAVGISKYFGCVSPVYYVFKVTEGTDLRYIYYLFTNVGFQKEMRKHAKGILEIRLRISSGDMLKLSIPNPSYEEQHRIADFLDRKCAEIDAVIEKTKATIEEYKKLKQSVITEAVTKGIRGNRPMKDSGIEWIGEIPDEWKTAPLKAFIDILPGYAFSSDDFSTESGIPLLRGINVAPNGIRWDETVRYNLPITEQLIPFQLQEGDIVVGLDRPWISDGTRIAWITKDDVPSLLLQRVCRIRAKESTDLRWVYHWIASSAFQESLSTETTGVSVPHISTKQIGNFVIALPSPEEQNEVCNFLDERCAALDTLIAKKTALLTELETYKKSLIYEYVTGKKEV